MLKDLINRLDNIVKKLNDEDSAYSYKYAEFKGVGNDYGSLTIRYDDENESFQWAVERYGEYNWDDIPENLAELLIIELEKENELQHY